MGDITMELQLIIDTNKGSKGGRETIFVDKNIGQSRWENRQSRTTNQNPYFGNSSYQP